MNDFKTYRVDTFLLKSEWQEQFTTGRLSYVVRGGKNKEEHMKFCDEFKQKLIDDNDEKYTSWVFTYQVYKCTNSFDPHVSVLQFRIRDAY